MVVLRIVQELTKMVMFILLWGTPPLMAWVYSCAFYLLLYFVSIIGTFILFSHFEKLGYGKTNKT